MHLDPAAFVAFLCAAIMSAIATAALAYAVTQDSGIPGLRAVALAYALNTLRFVAMALEPSAGVHALFAMHLLNAASAVFLAYGGLRLAGMGSGNRILVPGLVLAAALAAWCSYGGMVQSARVLVAAQVGAVSLFVFAWGLYGYSRSEGRSCFRIVAVAALLSGLARAAFPAWAGNTGMSVAGYALAAGFYFGTAFALVVALQRTQYIAMREARRRAEATQNLAQVAFDSTTDFMSLLRVEPDGRFVVEMVNRSLVKFLENEYPGRPPLSHQGRDIADVMRDAGLPEERVQSILQGYRDARDTRQSVTTLVPYGEKRRSGVMTPLMDADGRVARIFYRGTDVTEQHRAAEMTERLAKVFSVSPLPLAVTREADGKMLDVNDAWLRFFGAPREAVLGRTALELGMWISPADRERLLAPLRRGERVSGLVLPWRRRDGTVLDCMFSGEALEWQGERAILASLQDVTEIEHARREAMAAGERFARLFETSPVPAIITQRDTGRILEVNQAMNDAYGYARSDIRGRTTLEAGLWRTPAERAWLTGKLQSGQAVRGVPMRLRRADGEEREVLLSAETIDWKGDRAIVGFMPDVTELQRAAEEVRRLNGSLEERVRDRTAELEGFASSVSHDLRAPLRAMTSFATLLSERPAISADAQALGYAERIRRAAARMGVLIDGLLRHTRLAREPIRLLEVRLSEEVAALAREAGELASGRRIDWRIGTLPTVSGDPALLRVVLQNLLDNAVKYTRGRDEALIEVNARVVEGEVEVSVRDNGVGFDMAHAADLFRPFYRLHDEAFEGTGIGLAHARRIVERHGGRMWCEASPGEGARFCFTLPH